MQEFILQFIVIPLLIFCARITDVSLGTLRIILLSRGYRVYVPFLGFFEVLLWLIVMTHIVKTLSHPIYYVAYAGGFAAGNWVGMMIENRLAMGISLVRIILSEDNVALVQRLRSEGYVVTEVTGYGNRGPVRILFTVVKRRELVHLLAFVREMNPDAFYTIEDVNFVSREYALALHSPKSLFDEFPFSKKK
ncbi:MAG: DUF2179 domain-containing protein [candidate division KSB1 bacterium]|nr:DUF2179 domain-containing protein [candidate division KSB1 bacterium]MDZ7346662.1 DUF2179 domain-containing protein [candidate division KSB1 bacterium]